MIGRRFWRMRRTLSLAMVLAIGFTAVPVVTSIVPAPVALASDSDRDDDRTCSRVGACSGGDAGHTSTETERAARGVIKAAVVGITPDDSGLARA